MQVPNYIDATAKSLWKKYKQRVGENFPELLAIYCQCLSDYRTALETQDGRQKKMMLDFVLKYGKELGLTPRTNKETPPTPEVTDDEFRDL